MQKIKGIKTIVSCALVVGCADQALYKWYRQKQFYRTAEFTLTKRCWKSLAVCLTRRNKNEI